MTDQLTATNTNRRAARAGNQDRHVGGQRPTGARRRARATGLAATLCAVAAGAAVLASAAPSSAATAPATTAAVRPHTIILGHCGELYAFRVVTNIRAAAGTWNPIVGQGQPGQWFDAKYETSYSYSGYRWVWGVDLDTDVGGWVAVQLLTDLGPSGCTTLS